MGSRPTASLLRCPAWALQSSLYSRHSVFLESGVQVRRATKCRSCRKNTEVAVDQEGQSVVWYGIWTQAGGRSTPAGLPRWWCLMCPMTLGSSLMMCLSHTTQCFKNLDIYPPWTSEIVLNLMQKCILLYRILNWRILKCYQWHYGAPVFPLCSKMVKCWLYIHNRLTHYNL